MKDRCKSRAGSYNRRQGKRKSCVWSSLSLGPLFSNVPKRQIAPLRDIILRFLNGKKKKKILVDDPSKPITIPTNLHSMMRFLNNCGDLSESQNTKANPKSLNKRKPWGANIIWGQSKLLAIPRGCFLLFWAPLILKPQMACSSPCGCFLLFWAPLILKPCDGSVIHLVPPFHRSRSLSMAFAPAPIGRSASCLFPRPSEVKSW